MRLFYLILASTFISCNSTDDKSKNISLQGSKFDTTLIRGAWWTCSKLKDFRLIEFGDTVYQYFEFEQYIGPSVLFKYTVQNDSLFLDSDETSFKERWVIAKLDSTTMTLIDKYDTTVFNKIQLEHPLKYYSDTNDKEYSKQFFALKRNFACNN